MGEAAGTPFTIEVSFAEGDVRIVAVGGELDVDTAPRFGGVLHDLVAKGGQGIVIDASELTFIDSSGISVLVAAARSAEAARATLVVAVPTPHVQRVFDIVCLTELVPVEQDLEGALQRAGGRRGQSAG